MIITLQYCIGKLLFPYVKIGILIILNSCNYLKDYINMCIKEYPRTWNNLRNKLSYLFYFMNTVMMMIIIIFYSLANYR